MGTILSRDETRHYFAWRIDRFVTLGALAGEHRQYEQEFVQRSVELVSCLVNGRSEEMTFDLRTICRPDEQVPARGTITMALLGRVDGVSVGRAEEVARAIGTLLIAEFDEFDFAAASEKEVGQLLDPFPIKHVTGISRRCAWQFLDSLGRSSARAPIGFVGESDEVRAAAALGPAPGVLHIYPFKPAFSRADRLFTALLRQRVPVLISCRLRPTALLRDEEAILEEQIATCESYSQVSVGSGDPSAVRPTLQQRARVHLVHLLRTLQALKDDAAVMVTEIASSEPIEGPLANLVAHHLTEASGAPLVEERAESFLAGGYELVAAADGKLAARAIRALEVEPWGRPDVAASTRRLLFLFDPTEAAAAFRLPAAGDDAPPGVAPRRWWLRPAPPNLPATGALLGVSRAGGPPQEVRVGGADRLRHVYVVGQTGTGKTTLLKSMLLDDIASGEGVCLIDPHGDLFTEILDRIPAARAGDVVVLDPSDMEAPVGINLLEWREPGQRRLIAQEMVGIISRLIADDYGTQAGMMTGPVFFQHLRMGLLLVMSDPACPGTLMDVYRVFGSNLGWKSWMPLKVEDPDLKLWVDEVMTSTRYANATSDGPTMGAYVNSKLEGFVFDPRVKGIFGQRHTTVDFRALMDERKILLVNLAKGLLTEATSRFLGMIVLGKLMSAAMSRVTVAERNRPPFHIYVDEFQSMATESFISMLSEGRKFGVGLVLANQFVSQVKEERITGAVFGNVGTIVAFRAGAPDAEKLENYFSPTFTRASLTTLPNHNAVIATLVHGESVPPFSLETVLNQTPADRRRAASIRAASRSRWGRPRAQVERELSGADRVEEPKSPFAAE